MQKHHRNQIIGISLVLMFLGVMMIGGIDTITGLVSSSKCGNYVCEVEENIVTCPNDCLATCGDNICEENERFTCVIDCLEARTAKIEEKAYFTGAIWLVFAASIALLLVGVAVISKPRRKTRRRKIRRSQRLRLSQKARLSKKRRSSRR